MEIRVDDRELRAAIQKLMDQGKDPSPALVSFYQDWKAIVAAEWSKIRGTGGTFRGQTWAGFKPQYTRKTDGVTVPAWGGVPRVYNGFRKSAKGPGRGKSTGQRMAKVSGNVSGKLRPSGKRVTATSVMNMDIGFGGTESIAGAIVNNRPVILNKSRLRIGGNLPPHAKHILVDHNRNPLFFKLPEDQERLNMFARKWLDGLASRFNRGTP